MKNQQQQQQLLHHKNNNNIRTPSKRTQHGELFSSLMGNDCRLSDSPLTTTNNSVHTISSSLPPPPSTTPSQQLRPDPENPSLDTVKSIENSKRALQNSNGLILSQQQHYCTNKPSSSLPPSLSSTTSQGGSSSTSTTSTQYTKFITPPSIPVKVAPAATEKQVNHFKPPQNFKRKLDDTNNSQSQPIISSNNNVSKSSLTTKTEKESKKRKKNEETSTFRKTLFETVQKELSNQPLTSSINPLTPSPENNDQDTMELFDIDRVNNTCEETPPVGIPFKNSTNFVVLSDSQDSITLSEDEVDECKIDNDIVEKAVNLLFNSTHGRTLAKETKEKYLRDLIDPKEISTLGLESLFGKNYPAIGSITFNNNTKGPPVFTLLTDGSPSNTSKDMGKSIYHSYSRLARLLMGLHIGKAMMFVNFAEDDWEKDDKKSLIYDVCLNGFCHQKYKYKFFGTSNSGINGYSALFLDSRLNFSAIHNLLGDFSECAKSGARKVFSRMALSLGKSFQSSIELKEGEWFVLQDEENYPGVDGAGFMHEDYFRQVLQYTNQAPFFDSAVTVAEGNCTKVMDCEINDIVAFQFRALGMKGVVQSIPDEYWKELQKQHGFSDSVKCVVRPSLVKFVGNGEIYRNFDILNVSRIQGGSINRTFMSCMLKRTSNKEAMKQLFLNMLEEYIIAESNQNPIFLHNSLSGDIFDSGESSVYKTVKELLLAGYDMKNPFIYKYIKRRIKNKFQSLIDNKLCLKIKSKYSVTLIGVIDESGELADDEVYIPCLKLQEQLRADYYKLNEVIVYRHPLAFEGDIVKLKLRKEPCNSFLASRLDVIVFPKCFRKKGPHQLMSGGDLDGDKYEIVFDLKILNLFDLPSTPIDYDEGKQDTTASQQQPVPKLSSNSIITEHVKCFLQKHMNTGLLFYYCTIARDTDDMDLKEKLAKAYSDSIDSMKGYEQNFKELFVRSQKLPKPAWYGLSKTVKLSKKKLNFQPPTEDSFENIMLNKIVKAYQEVAFNKPATDLDTSLIIECGESNTKVRESLLLQWKNDFFIAYRQWNEHWKNHKKTTTKILDYTQNDHHHNERFNNILASMVAYTNKCNPERNKSGPNWEELFIKDTLGKHLLAKASYWMQLAYEEEKTLIAGNNQGNNKFKKSILKSPFLYACALPYIAKLNYKSENSSLIHPEIRVKMY